MFLESEIVRARLGTAGRSAVSRACRWDENLGKLDEVMRDLGVLAERRASDGPKAPTASHPFSAPEEAASNAGRATQDPGAAESTGNGLILLEERADGS